MKLELILSVLILSAVYVQAGSDGKCRALALAGGGDKGSYQAAVLKTLIYNLPPIET